MKGPWVAGVLANNVWSFGGSSGRGGTRCNTFLVQPFVNYNLQRIASMNECSSAVAH
jgi:hypothetical protein